MKRASSSKISSRGAMANGPSPLKVPITLVAANISVVTDAPRASKRSAAHMTTGSARNASG